MPRLHVLAVNARLPAWAEQACADYARRMPKGYEVSRLDVKAARLDAAVPKGTRLVVLDERGEDLGSVEFSRLLGEPATFVVGGADGLPEPFRKKAHLVLRLSSLTLAHALAQVVLMEQLYRAATLRTGHPYHRA